MFDPWPAGQVHAACLVERQSIFQPFLARAAALGRSEPFTGVRVRPRADLGARSRSAGPRVARTAAPSPPGWARGGAPAGRAWGRPWARPARHLRGEGGE